MRVNKNTVHLLRLKMMNALGDIRESTKLQGKIETDDIYESINLKGTKPEKIPRASNIENLKVQLLEELVNIKYVS